MKTREQERMALALAKISEIKNNKELAPGYSNACLAFAPLVRAAGLCQAVAFLHSRDTNKGAYQRYLADLEEHLRQAGLLPAGTRLIDQAPSVDVTGYMLLTREALACALWHKRFAQSELDADAAEMGR